MRFLPQRVGPDAALCVAQGTWVVTLPLQVGQELIQRLKIALGQPLPLLQDPVLVVSRKQRAAVTLYGLGQKRYPLAVRLGPRRGAKGRPEGGDVGGDEFRV